MAWFGIFSEVGLNGHKCVSLYLGIKARTKAELLPTLAALRRTAKKLPHHRRPSYKIWCTYLWGVSFTEETEEHEAERQFIKKGFIAQRAQRLSHHSLFYRSNRERMTYPRAVLSTMYTPQQQSEWVVPFIGS